MKSIKAKKSLGQNFLQDTRILERIASYLDISEKNILEVGPGYGALTDYLIEKYPRSLHLVELDRDMINILESKVQSQKWNLERIDFQIFHRDILKFEPEFGIKKDTQIQGRSRPTTGGQSMEKMGGKGEGKNIRGLQGKGGEDYYVIANIPYYITSPILTHFLYTLPVSPQKMLILMQREVGERILERKVGNDKGQMKDKNGKKSKVKSSVLSLMVAKKGFVEKVIDVPRMAFSPVPKVESIVLAFEKHDLFQDSSDDQFLDFIKLCFAQPRKKLLNNLVAGGYSKEKVLLVLRELGFSELRPENLSLQEMIHLQERIEGLL